MENLSTTLSIKSCTKDSLDCNKVKARKRKLNNIYRSVFKSL